MHARKPISESSRKSKDRTSEDGKKRKKSSGANAQDDTDAKGASDSPTADEPTATEETFLSAPSRVISQDDYDYDATGKGGRDTDWLYQPDLNHADSTSLITQRFKAERILKRIHFNQKRRRRRRLTVEPSCYHWHTHRFYDFS